MTPDPTLRNFVSAAKGSGASDQFVVDLLKSRGWPDDTVLSALGSYYEELTSVPIPVHTRSGEAAKDAFFYLLAFSTLGIWAMSLGSLLFTLIDRWISDPVFASRNQGFSGGDDIPSSIASILVAFPIYLFVMRLILRDVERHPDKLNSAVRKWLTYVALFIAAGFIIGDLVTFFTALLRGEVTSRFVAKVAVVIVIAGSIFWYYLGSLKHAEPEIMHADA